MDNPLVIVALITAITGFLGILVQSISGIVTAQINRSATIEAKKLELKSTNPETPQLPTGEVSPKATSGDEPNLQKWRDIPVPRFPWSMLLPMPFNIISVVVMMGLPIRPGKDFILIIAVHVASFLVCPVLALHKELADRFRYQNEVEIVIGQESMKLNEQRLEEHKQKVKEIQERLNSPDSK